MTKIIRNMSTPEARRYWESAKRIAAEVETWPAERRVGINVSATRASACVEAATTSTPPESKKRD